MAGNKSKHPERRKQRVPENKKRKQRQSKKVRNDKNQRNDNVVVYKPPVNINLGLGIFVLLIGYLAIIIIFARHEQQKTYHIHHQSHFGHSEEIGHQANHRVATQQGFV